jgi:hypothetical protein
MNNRNDATAKRMKSTEIKELNKLYDADMSKLEDERASAEMNMRKEIQNYEQILASIDDRKARLNTRREEHLNYLTSPKITQQENVSQFRVLPSDVILYILRYYELPLMRYWNRVFTDDGKLISEELMQLLFGYFPVNDNRRTIHTIFTSIDLYHSFVENYIQRKSGNDVLIYNILRTKSIASLHSHNFASIKSSYEYAASRCVPSEPLNLSHLKKMSVDRIIGAEVDQYFETCKNVPEIAFAIFGFMPSGITNLSNVTRWKIECWSPDTELPTIISHCINLKELVITDSNCNDPLFNSIASLPRLKKLSISVTSSQFKVNPNLTELSLEFKILMALDHVTMVAIMNLKHLHTLKILHEVDLSAESIPLFASNTTIKRLTISNPSKEIMTHIFQNRTVRHLAILVHHGDDIDLLTVDGYPLWSHLDTLKLSGIQSDETFEIITKNAKTLTSLVLNNCEISGDSMKKINQNLSQLHTLRIEEVDYSNDNSAIMYAFMNPNLTRLELSQCLLSVDTIRYAKYCNSLHTFIHEFDFMHLLSSYVQLLMKMKSLRVLSVVCTDINSQLQDAIQDNHTLESLVMRSIISMSEAYSTADHIPFFGYDVIADDDQDLDYYDEEDDYDFGDYI